MFDETHVRYLQLRQKDLREEAERDRLVAQGRQTGVADGLVARVQRWLATRRRSPKPVQKQAARSDVQPCCEGGR